MTWNQQDWKRLEDATNGNCGIILYKSIKNTKEYSSPDMRFVTNEIVINTTVHIIESLTLPDIAVYVKGVLGRKCLEIVK